MKKVILFLTIGFFWYSLGWAQQNDSKKEAIFEVQKVDSTAIVNQFGMNLTPLLVQLIPLNRGTTRTGPYGFSYNRVNAKNKFFRLGLGVLINDEDLNNSHLNLRIGGGKIRKISEKWHLTTGWDFVIFGGSFNVPSSNEDDDGGIGFGPFMGLQYYLTKDISLSTESFLFMGTTVNTPVTFRVIPPVSLFVNINFVATPKKRFRNRNRSIQNMEEDSKPFIERN
ncbi:MAG: hypothetical protein R3E32_18355 [Chitinophagales bacterium]